MLKSADLRQHNQQRLLNNVIRIICTDALPATPPQNDSSTMLTEF
jgi:hypothetical protein